MQNHTVITHRVPSHRTGIPEDVDRLATFLEANPFASDVRCTLRVGFGWSYAAAIQKITKT